MDKANQTKIVVGYGADGWPIETWVDRPSRPREPAVRTLSQASYVPARAFWKKQARARSVVCLRSILPEPAQPRAGRTVTEWLEQHRRGRRYPMNNGQFFSRPPTPAGLFGKLPEAVKLRIWDLAVRYAGAFVITRYRADGGLSYHRALVPRDQGTFHTRGFPANEDNVTALQRVSSPIHRAARDLFYRNNTFHIPHDPRTTPGHDAAALLAAFRSQIGPPAFAQTASICFIMHQRAHVEPGRPGRQQPLIEAVSAELRAVVGAAAAHCAHAPRVWASVGLALGLGGGLRHSGAAAAAAAALDADPNHPDTGLVRAIHAGDTDEGRRACGFLARAGQRTGRQRVAMEWSFSLRAGLDAELARWERAAAREATRLELDVYGDPIGGAPWAGEQARMRSEVMREAVRCMTAVRARVSDVLPTG